MTYIYVHLRAHMNAYFLLITFLGADRNDYSLYESFQSMFQPEGGNICTLI